MTTKVSAYMAKFAILGSYDKKGTVVLGYYNNSFSAEMEALHIRSQGGNAKVIPALGGVLSKKHEEELRAVEVLPN